MAGRLRKARTDGAEAEEERQRLSGQNRKLKREKQELEDDVEEMAERLKELKSRARKEGADMGTLRDRERELGEVKGRAGELGRQLDRLRSDLANEQEKFKEKERQLEREKEQNAEKNFKSIVGLKAANQDQIEALKDELREQEELVARLLGEQKEIKDYTGKLEREIFNLSQEKEKFEGNLKKVMANWEHEEMRRYNSERQLTGVLEGKDNQIDELRQKLNQVDNFHKDATEKISRNADFYKNKAESLEESKNLLSKKVRELEATVKHVQEEADGDTDSHLNLQTVGGRTLTERGGQSNAKTKSKSKIRNKSKHISNSKTRSKQLFVDSNTRVDSEGASTGRGEAETLEERHERVSQVVSTTVRMDGDLVKMLYTQAKCIDARLFGDSEDEDAQEAEMTVMQQQEDVAMAQRGYSHDQEGVGMGQRGYTQNQYGAMVGQEHPQAEEMDSRDEEEDSEGHEMEHEAYQEFRLREDTRANVYHPVVDNTMSSNPEKVYVDANQARDEEEKFILESEAEDGDKLRPAYLIDGDVYNIVQDPNAYDVQEIRQMMPKGPDQQGHAENHITQFQPGAFGNANPRDEEADDELIEGEYTDNEDVDDPDEPADEEVYRDMPQNEQIRVGHRVAGPIPGNQMPAEMDYEGQYEEYEEGVYEDEEYEEEGYDEDEVRQVAESGGFGPQGYDQRQGEGRYAAQEQGFGRQPGPTFGVGKQ